MQHKGPPSLFPMAVALLSKIPSRSSPQASDRHFSSLRRWHKGATPSSHVSRRLSSEGPVYGTNGTIEATRLLGPRGLSFSPRVLPQVPVPRAKVSRDSGRTEPTGAGLGGGRNRKVTPIQLF